VQAFCVSVKYLACCSYICTTPDYNSKVNIESLNTTIQLTKEQILQDYYIAQLSRQCSILGRKEVFAGKAKFGIFGDGKEVPQLAMARAFKPGDWRSGYYRDQTFMFAIGELTAQQFFAQLYAHADVNADPHSAGRQMSCHFATRSLDENGEWKNLTSIKNSSPDISPTAGQMPRLLGLAYASKLFRLNKHLHQFEQFSINGNEIAFGTIGNASTSEGMFFEAMNAAGVLKVPMFVSVWDDDYGISVPKEYHTIKGSISEALSGFHKNEKGDGFEIEVVPGWDYAALVDAYDRLAAICRYSHTPVLLHVTELTQPQGHSTSGSHERYKSKERLKWEKQFDCNVKMREWILLNGYASEDELTAIDNQALSDAKEARNAAWKSFTNSIKYYVDNTLSILEGGLNDATCGEDLSAIYNDLKSTLNPVIYDALKAVNKALMCLRGADSQVKAQLLAWKVNIEKSTDDAFSSHLYSQSAKSIDKIEPVPVAYADNAALLDGREILQHYFTSLFARNPLVFAIGEDVGKIGDVNQGFAGLQEIYGDLRITDTGIRECTILGQGIGAALRGLRPIIEIQYLDYVMYALQTMSDDLATIHYRTKGGQKAPLIIRTRGHRLEGIWHAGSPMGTLIHSCRGILIAVPRNMTQAAGMYNTLIESDEPAIVIECLNGYRLKEKLPSNLDTFKVAFGEPEVLRSGNHITIVTYGSMVRIVMEAAEWLAKCGVEAEVIDVQTLLPFDIHHSITASIKKTGRVVFADEDVPGGATAFMMQEVLEKQGAYKYLDAAPATVTAKAHRTAYASDGDHFTKPTVDQVFEKAYNLMHEADPATYPALF
jgi:pyruvate/2-oxoglutarate/acetoin dehydrogenase E1 component/TPP-dependent pyruvate/acetoin dehydrogenase alpha subunit